MHAGPSPGGTSPSTPPCLKVWLRSPPHRYCSPCKPPRPPSPGWDGASLATLAPAAPAPSQPVLPRSVASPPGTLQGQGQRLGICVPRAWHSQDTQQRRRQGLLSGAAHPPPEGPGGFLGGVEGLWRGPLVNLKWAGVGAGAASSEPALGRCPVSGFGRHVRGGSLAGQERPGPGLASCLQFTLPALPPGALLAGQRAAGGWGGPPRWSWGSGKAPGGGFRSSGKPESVCLKHLKPWVAFIC